MLKRSAKKIKYSAEALQFLHSYIVLKENNQPRSTCLKE
jgi:hypothetical protein